MWKERVWFQGASLPAHCQLNGAVERRWEGKGQGGVL